MYNKNPRTLQKTSLASFESKTTTGAAAGAGAGFCGNKSTRSNLHNNSDNAISAGSRVDSPMNRRAASPPGLKSPTLIREAITNNSNTSVNSSNVGGTKLANRTNGIGSNSMNRSINSSSEATMMAPKAGSGMASTDQIVKIGDMVYIEGVNEVGTLKYLGPIADKNGVWAGIELDTPFAGKNNGNFNGVSYFSCTEQRGIFTSPAKLRVIPSVNTNTGVNGKTKNRNNSTVSNGSNYDTQSHNRNHRQSISSVGSPKVMNSKGTARPLGEYESIDSVLNPKQRLAIAPTLSNQQQNSKKQRNQKSQPQPPAQQKVPVSKTQSSNNSIDSNRSGALISERSTGQKSIGTRTKLREMVESRRKTLEPSAHPNTTRSKTTVVSPPTRAVKNSSAHHIQNGSKSGSISSGSGEGRSLQAAAGSSSSSKPIHDTRVELLEAENRVLRLENQQYKARITAGQWLATDMFEKENAIEASQSSSQSQIQDSTASENVSPNNKVANSSNSSTNSTVMRQLEQQLAEEREQNALLMAELENYKLLATNISSSNNINGSSSVLSNLNLNLNFNNDNENINNESELEQELARTREMLSDATIQAEIREHALLESQEACRVMEDKLAMFRDDTDALKRKIDVTQENLRSMLRRLSAFNSTSFTSVNNDNNEAIGDGERNDNVGNGMELANSWLQDTLIETIDADDSEMLFEYIDSALKTIKQKIDSAN
ncbi:Centrosome-associated protein, partial [Zancudomyces culisetae]